MPDTEDIIILILDEWGMREYDNPTRSSDDYFRWKWGGYCDLETGEMVMDPHDGMDRPNRSREPEIHEEQHYGQHNGLCEECWYFRRSE